MQHRRSRVALHPSNRLPREHAHEIRRERLVEAMTGVAAEGGYAAASVPRVADRAGMSTKTFYRVFSDRRDCFLAAYDGAVERALSAVREAYLSCDDPEEGFERAIDAFLRFCADEPESARICFLEVPVVRPGGEVRRRDTLMRVTELVRAHMERLREADPDGPRPAIAAEVVAGGIYNLIHERVRTGHTAELPELAPRITRAVLAAA